MENVFKTVLKSKADNFATNSQNWQRKIEKQGKYNDFILLYRTADKIHQSGCIVNTQNEVL